MKVTVDVIDNDVYVSERYNEPGHTYVRHYPVSYE